MNKVITILGILLVMSGCDDDRRQICTMGTVIGYEQCSNAVLLQINSDDQIGGSLTYYDNVAYENVVRAPGQVGEYGNSTIYFTYRSYDQSTDGSLFTFSETPCLAIYAPFEVPTVVVTDFSTMDCSALDL